MTDKVSFNINDGKTFFADEVSITNNPVKFIIDFKLACPRVDVRAEQGVPIVLEHNTIMMDTWLAKQFSTLLVDHIKKYEEQYGEIAEPPQVVQAKESREQHVTNTKQKPGYFG